MEQQQNLIARIPWRPLGTAVVLSLGFLLSLFLIAEFGRSHLKDAAEQVRQSQARRILVGDLQQLLTDAESGQRGYLISGEARYLEPMTYAARRSNQLADELATSYADEDPAIGESVLKLRYVAGEKMGEMNASIALARENGPAAALALTRTEAGQETMERFRALARAIVDYEAARVEQARISWQHELDFVRGLNTVATVINIGLVLLAIGIVFRDLRRRALDAAALKARHDELEAESAARAAELNELYGHLQTVQEEERARLSRGLHDELGGVLLAARMDVSWLQRHWKDDERTAQERLARVQRALDQGIDLKRRVVEELRPTLLDNMGLVAALRWQLDETCRRAGLECTERFPEHEPNFDRAGAISLFRVVQEALLNVLKHSKATEVEVELDISGDDVLLAVRDNGIGINPADAQRAKAHGLAGMRHRISVLGGKLYVERAPGGGTEIRASVPLASVVAPPREDTSASGTYLLAETLRRPA
jgi:signal transduction histidine kinase